MLRIFVRLVIGAMVVLGVGLAWALSNNPPVARTSALGLGIYPAEGNCTQCHVGNPLNNPTGSLTIEAPDTYQAGQTYPITVRLANSLADTTGISNPKWGFELSAMKASDGTGAGTLITPNPGTSPSFPDSLTIGVPTVAPYLGSGRQYIRQSGFATRTDRPSPVEWQFTWQAPASDQGKVYFFAAGNSANGNTSSSGDYIFTTSDSSTFTNPLPATSSSSWLVMLAAGLLLSGGFFLVRQGLRRQA